MSEHEATIRRMTPEESMRLSADILAAGGRPRWRVTGRWRIRVLFIPARLNGRAGAMAIEGAPPAVWRFYRRERQLRPVPAAGVVKDAEEETDG